MTASLGCAGLAGVPPEYFNGELIGEAAISEALAMVDAGLRDGTGSSPLQAWL